MLKLHIANKVYSSWSLRPWVLMTHLGIPFEEVLTPFGGEMPFHTFSPTGQVPCLIDGEQTIWESLAIVEHLAERFEGVWPAEAAARSWARSAAAEMHAGFGLVREVCSFDCTLRVQLHPLAPERQARLAAQWARVDDLWCEGLDRFGGPFLAGPAFTAVDAFYAPLAFRMQTYGITLSPPAQAYAEHLLALPAMRRWHAEACAEPWRDEPHDGAVRERGTVQLDERAGARTVREVCAACGEMLIDRTDGFPKVVGVVVDRFDPPIDFTPAHHVWAESRAPGTELPTDVPVFERGSA